MEIIVKQIEKSLLDDLVPFLAKKFDENGMEISTDTISAYVSEWLNKDAKKVKKPVSKNVSKTESKTKITEKKRDDFENIKLTKEILETLTLKKLQELCKLRTLTSSGTKATLQERLLNYQNSLDVREENLDDKFSDEEVVHKEMQASSNDEIFSSDEEIKKPKNEKPRKKLKSVKKQIIESIEKKREEIVLEKDEHGNTFDSITGFVFNKDDEVVGKKDKSGIIRELTEQDIKSCKSMNLEYICPFNLEEDDE